MIKKILIMVSVPLFLSACNILKNQKDNDFIQNDSIDYKTKKIIIAYDQLDYLLFFKSFPERYLELKDYYGYDDIKGAMPLYEFYEAHINYFFENAEKVGIEIFVNKVVHIAIGGVWDADAIGLFQSKLSKLIIEKPNLFIDILTDKSKQEVCSFWYFVFDGSSKYDIQNKKKFDAIFNKIDSLSQYQGNILKRQFKKMY